MAAGDKQGDERKFRWLLFKHWRQQVTFHMMHAQRRDAPGEGQGLSAGRTDQQRADQARTGGVGDGIDVGGHAVGLGQYLADQRQHALDVVTGGELRHHPAVDAVQVDLAEQRIGQQAALAVIKGDAGFIAGCFQSQY